MQSIIRRIMLIILVIAILCFSFVPIISSVFAATTYTQSVKSGIDAFPTDYQQALKQIKVLHPNWTFDAYYTGLDWNNNLILNETATHGRNRVIKTSEESWKCSCGDIASGYACASQEIIEYYIDPRNFLNEVNVFQFLEISYNSNIHTLDGIKSAVKNTFLDNNVTYELDGVTYTKTYSEIILEAAKQSNMSPYSIVTKIIQEVGSKGSDSVSGTYSGYQGYYNFYNWGAYDTGNAIVNALLYARDQGWNNQYTAIIEGAKKLSNSYTNAGQNTAYFYKWDVVGTSILKAGCTQTVSSSDMFWHQYMTNVQDPTSQSSSLYNTYAKNGILDKNLNFIIPVYNNMPNNSNCLPSDLTTNDGDLYFVNCTDGLRVRQSPTTSSTQLTTLYKGTVVAVIEREATEANGYKWDKVKLESGVIGYVASKYLTSLQSNTGQTEEIKFKYDGNDIILIPGIKLTDISKNATGELKTGGKLTVDGKEFMVIFKGDTNGDGKSSAADYVLIKNHIMQTALIKEAEKLEAADINNDGKISPADYVLIKNYIMNDTNFTL